MRVDLMDVKWEVQGFWPWVPLWRQSMETGKILEGITGWLPATVPGGVHGDLLKAGWIRDPLYAMQSMESEWVENRWWLYRATLPVPPMAEHQRLFLTFQGLDDEAWISVNEREVAHHQGPFEPVTIDVTGLAEGRSEMSVLVLFKQAPDEMGQIGRTSATKSQRSRFAYKWDFGTRLVNLGIWDQVYFDRSEEVALDDLLVTTDVIDGDTGVIDVSLGVNRFTDDRDFLANVWVEVSCSDEHGQAVGQAKMSLGADDRARGRLTIPEADRWYPNGSGAQPLYAITVTLYRDESVKDQRTIKTGIRRLRFQSNPGAPAAALPYTVVVNDQKIYLQGVNITPLDHVYGSVTSEQYAWLVKSMADAHINLVRINGVGLIEKECFYELCDAYGIMIWQEFIQTSYGPPHPRLHLPRAAPLARLTRRPRPARPIKSRPIRA